MTPRYMQCHHDPEIGAHGDCMRACVASVLNLPVEAVPHFFDYPEPDPALGYERIQGFLKPKGLVYWQVSVPAAMLDEVAGSLGYHIMSGRDPITNTDHAVVAEAGKVVHNPDPRGDLCLEPFELDGVAFFAVGVICVR